MARGVPGIVGVIAIAAYTSLLSPDDYGRYALVIAGVGLLNVILFQWLQVAIVRFYPIYLSEPLYLLHAVRQGYLSLVLSSAVIGIVVLLIAPNPDWRPVILVAIPLLWMQAWYDIVLQLIRSQLMPIRFGLMSGVKAICAFGLGVLGAAAGLGEYGPLIGLTIGLFIASVAFGPTGWSRPTEAKPGRITAEMLRYGLPLTVTLALTYIVAASDRLLIAMLLGEAAAGVYSAAYDLTQQTLTVLMVAVNLAAYPLIVRAHEENGLESSRVPMQRSATFLMGIGVPATVGFCILASNISTVILGSGFSEEATTLLPIVAIGVLLSGLRAFHFDLAFQLGRNTLRQLWAIGAAAILNILLNLWWIPKIGIVGAAYATVVAYAVALVLSAIVGRRTMPVPLPIRNILKILSASSVMGLVLVPISHQTGLFSLVVQIAVGALVYSALTVLFNVGGVRSRLPQLIPR